MSKQNSQMNPIGQYPSDYIYHADNQNLGQDPLGIMAMRGDGDITLHTEYTLFDEGGHLDEVSGRVVSGSKTVQDDIVALEGMAIVSPYERQKRSREEHMDAADLWLRENDPNYGK